MKRVLAILALLLASVAPVKAQETYWMEFVFFAPEGSYGETEPGCSIDPNAFLMSVNVKQEPYAPEGKFIVPDGRIVTSEGSPVAGVAGCVHEATVTFTEFAQATFTLEIAYLGGSNVSVDLGTVHWDDMPEYGRGEEPTIFILDVESIQSGSVDPFVPDGWGADATPESTPDYLATIEAQEAEIEDLKATIEAIATPAP